MGITPFSGMCFFIYGFLLGKAQRVWRDALGSAGRWTGAGPGGLVVFFRKSGTLWEFNNNNNRGVHQQLMGIDL